MFVEFTSLYKADKTSSFCRKVNKDVKTQEYNALACSHDSVNIPAEKLVCALRQKIIPINNSITFRSNAELHLEPIKGTLNGDVWRIKHKSIKNLFKIGENLYKGSAPFREEDVNFIKETLGAKTVLSFVTHKEMLDLEKKWTAANDIKFINIQLESPYDLLKEEKFNQIKEVLQNKEMWPIYMHCDIGMTRSVSVIGMYRLLNGMDKADVQKELPLLSPVYKDKKLAVDLMNAVDQMINK